MALRRMGIASSYCPLQFSPSRGCCGPWRAWGRARWPYRGNGLLLLSLLAERHAEVNVGVDVFGVGLDGLAEDRIASSYPAFSSRNRGFCGPGRGRGRARWPSEDGDRLLRLSLTPGRGAEVIVGIACFGSSSMAFRRKAIASSYLRCSFKTLPRLLWALTASGRDRWPRGAWRWLLPCPFASRASPRFLWALTYFGSSSMALRRMGIASSYRPFLFAPSRGCCGH